MTLNGKELNTQNFEGKWSLKLAKTVREEDSICYSGLLKHEVEVLYTMNSMTWVRR